MNVNASKIWNKLNRKKISSVKSNNCTYLSVNNNDGMNIRNNETYDLQFKNGKIMMTTTIITEHMIMHCSINTYKLKLLYQYKRKNSTYHFYDNTV